ncbi:hypothetical protein C4K23_5210 [Pseudomonas chlororaphis]|uniref:Uncharacterized protein n=2 Tax=Pseudomonas chlororaphis TaxID=587753 RepID=A0A3G7I3V0_9PSED|nr:hypothetical protein C4K38_5619 [Pseudomonas chlororaphis subsp. piscium]AZD04592.1 hypothetical protein C4K27_5433 [Pseudomonas chlororaphis subsp. chlororaphis]AZD10650.1 hypothetical protein C4K26_5282 [Pseudomonas chlororaphis]AZD24615.1 hypothetical protein C4K24_5347 [Pseudomonas chlororaphis subsp. aurantiaca]AZD95017.1 hypothetical protein C4K13_5635 [Pseudomonas chlororaphis subsp. aureofaciens]
MILRFGWTGATCTISRTPEGRLACLELWQSASPGWLDLARPLR